MISEEDFVECMNKDFPHLRVTRNDLAVPTQQFVTRYYSTMVEEVMRMPLTSVCNITDDQRRYLSTCVDASSLHDHIVSHNLYKTVKYIFDKIELFTSEFHYSDILFPFNSPKRTFVFMSTLYNFYSSCAEFDECYERIDTVVTKANTIAQLQQEKLHLTEKIEQNEKQKVVFANEIKNFKAELSELSERNNEEQNAIKDLQAEEEIQLEKLHVSEDKETKMQKQFTEVDNERKYYESLIVSDSDLIINNHEKLMNKKDECFKKLRELERHVQDGSFKVGQFDTILNLYDTLQQVLQEEIIVGAKNYDLKGINTAASMLKKELKDLSKEETELQLKRKEKDEAISIQQNELTRLESDHTIINQAWIERNGKYRERLSDLQRSISEFDGRAQIEEAEIRELSLKIEEMSSLIKEGENEINESNKICKEEFYKFEKELIRVFHQIVAQMKKKSLSK